MKKQLSILLLIYISIPAFSQNTFYIDGLFSGVNLTNTQIIAQDPKIGLSGELAFRYQLPYEKLSVGTLFNMGSFTEYPIDQISFNNLSFYKTGLQIHYSLLKSLDDEFEISFLGEAGYTWAQKDSSYIIPDGSYTMIKYGSSWSYSSEDIKEYNLYKGKGLSFLGAIRLRYSFFFIECSYEIFSPNMASDDYIVHNPSKKIQLDRFNFGGGISRALKF